MSRVEAMTTNLEFISIELIAFGRYILLVEDRDTAQRAALPFGVIFLELGVDRLEERANEGNLEGRTDD